MELSPTAWPCLRVTTARQPSLIQLIAAVAPTLLTGHALQIEVAVEADEHAGSTLRGMFPFPSAKIATGIATGLVDIGSYLTVRPARLIVGNAGKTILIGTIPFH